MSKTCVMVQYTVPYVEFGSELQQARTARMFEEAEKYIKARKSPTAGVWRAAKGIVEAEVVDTTNPPLVQQWIDDYRRPHLWNVPVGQVDTVMYTMFTDAQSANEWVDFCRTVGCYDVKIVTEADRGVNPSVPSTLADFPTDEQIAPFLWTE